MDHQDDTAAGFKWPRIGDIAFANEANTPHVDWTFNACMDRQPTSHRYAAGYRRGAELLFRHIALTGEREHNDLAVYPIMFCWRQYLELSLKTLLVQSQRLLRDRETAPLLHHRIGDIWHDLRPLLEELGGGAVEDLESVGQVVKEFALHDADSIAFRYPTDRQGRSTQTAIPIRINLRNLDEVMTRVANFLDAAGDYVHHELGLKADFEAAFDGPDEPGDRF